MNVAFTILVVLIVLAAILLIIVVLLQNGKDGGLATNFTSANQALGVRQTATILEKATWYLIGFILVLAIASTLIIAHNSTSSNSVESGIIDKDVTTAQPGMMTFPPQENPTAETPADASAEAPAGTPSETPAQ